MPFEAEALRLLGAYTLFFPKATFPYVTLLIAGVLQVAAWFGARWFDAGYGLASRILGSWLLALLEYLFLIPGIHVSALLLKKSETLLVVYLHACQLAVFALANRFLLKNPFSWRKALALVLVVAAVYLARDSTVE